LDTSGIATVALGKKQARSQVAKAGVELGHPPAKGACVGDSKAARGDQGATRGAWCGKKKKRKAAPRKAAYLWRSVCLLVNVAQRQRARRIRGICSGLEQVVVARLPHDASYGHSDHKQRQQQ
jgi:hypothetical protein